MLESIMIIIVSVLLIAMIIILSAASHEDGYRQGQIDYANGKIKFKKEVNEDGETIWEEQPKTK